MNERNRSKKSRFSFYEKDNFPIIKSTSALVGADLVAYD